LSPASPSPRENITDIIQLVIDSRHIDVNIRMGILHLGQPFGGGDQKKTADMRAAGLLEQIDGGDQRSAGGQHGVQNQGDALLHVGGHLDVVPYRLEGLLIAVQPDHTHLCGRDQVQHAVHHSQAGPQDGNHCDFLPLILSTDHLTRPALDGPGFGLQVLGGLIGQQAGQFRFCV
jgi:hypothetical protein